jgi:hypothetical protein
MKSAQPNLVFVSLEGINQSSKTTNELLLCHLRSLHLFIILPVSFPRPGIRSRTFDANRALPADD